MSPYRDIPSRRVVILLRLVSQNGGQDPRSNRQIWVPVARLSAGQKNYVDTINRPASPVFARSAAQVPTFRPRPDSGLALGAPRPPADIPPASLYPELCFESYQPTPQGTRPGVDNLSTILKNTQLTPAGSRPTALTIPKRPKP